MELTRAVHQGYELDPEQISWTGADWSNTTELDWSVDITAVDDAVVLQDFGSALVRDEQGGREGGVVLTLPGCRLTCQYSFVVKSVEVTLKRLGEGILTFVGIITGSGHVAFVTKGDSLTAFEGMLPNLGSELGGQGREVCEGFGSNYDCNLAIALSRDRNCRCGRKSYGGGLRGGGSQCGQGSGSQQDQRRAVVV